MLSAAGYSTSPSTKWYYLLKKPLISEILSRQAQSFSWEQVFCAVAGGFGLYDDGSP